MRSFEEVKEMTKSSTMTIMARNKNRLTQGKLEDWKKTVLEKSIQDCENYIENIDEVTIMEIGAATRDLIEAIRSAYNIYLTEYYQNFERFMNEHVMGLKADGSPKEGGLSYFGQIPCWTLGININDLMCFKGHNPMSVETADMFKKTVNANFGTHIPMAIEMQQAMDDYINSSHMDNNVMVSSPKALVHLRELQRDAGTLKNGGSYHLLATDLEYQTAKQIGAERSL